MAFSDPFSSAPDPFGGVVSRPRQRAAMNQPLDPEQSQSLGRQVLDTGLGGLRQVLGALDKPHQVVNNLLVGRPGAALRNAVPFSHAMGLAGPEDEVTGRDLTDTYGLTDKSDKGWGAWGAGLAADVATDPLTYLGLGPTHAVSDVGKVAKGIGATKGWGREALLKGFGETTSGLEKAGKTAGEIENIANKGTRIASPELESAVQKAGVATPIKDAPLGGLANFHIPFTDIHTDPFFTGPRSQAIARGMDTAGNYLKYGNPIGRVAGRLFDKKGTGEAISRLGQESWAGAGQPELEAGMNAARLNRADLAQKIDPIFQANDWHEQMRQGLEPAQQASFPEALNNSDITRAIQGATEGTLQDLPPQLQAEGGKVADLSGFLRNKNAGQIAQLKEWGAPVGEYESQWGNNYLHREASNAYPHDLQLGAADRPKGRLFPQTTGSSLHRDPVFDLPGGVNQVNDMFRQFAGLDRGTIAPGKFGLGAPKNIPGAGLIQKPANLGPTVQQEIERQITDAAAAKGLPVQQYHDVIEAKAKALAKQTQAANKAYRGAEASPFMSENIAQTEYNRDLQHARQMASNKTAIQALGKGAVPIPEDATKEMLQQMGVTPLSSAAERLGLRTTPFSTGEEEMLKYGPPAPGAVPQVRPNQGALVQIHKLLAPHGTSVTADLLNKPFEELLGEVNRFGVPNSSLEDLAKDYTRMSAGEQLKEPIRWLDSATNMFKGLAYPGFLPSHVRNSVSAFTNNAIATGKPIQALKDVWEQGKVMRGTAGDLSHIPGVAGKTPAEQLASLRRLQAGAGIGNSEGLMNSEIVGGAPGVQSGLRPHLPGSGFAGNTGNALADAADLYFRQGIGGTIGNIGKAIKGSVTGKGIGKSFGENLGIKGVAGATEDTLPLVKAGRRIGENVETGWRGAMFNRALEDGMSPEVARDLVNKYHFDYGDMTQFEKNVMRRAVPFYTYTRKNLPLQLGQIMSNPGATVNQFRPLYQHSQAQPAGYVPGYLNSGAAIPIGGLTPEGTQQFIGKLGLPAEEAFEHMHAKNGLPDIANTVLDYMGGLNPIIKAPLEELFNTQFHSQRKLSDLRAQGTAKALGSAFGDENPQLLGERFAISPFTRFFSTADKIADPRKAWWQKALNLGSGVQVTDVNMDKQKSAETRDALLSILQDHPHIRQFTDLYARKEDQGSLTPYEIDLMRKWHEGTERAKQWAKQRAAQQASQ